MFSIRAVLDTDYSRTHTAITLEAWGAFIGLNQSENDESSDGDESHEADIKKFNEVCFLVMEKEQMQWHSAKDSQFHIGMTIAQARCLKMLMAGYLSFDEVFKNNVLFGIYSKTKLYDQFERVQEACTRVEKLYSNFLLSQEPKMFMAMSKRFIDDEFKPEVIATRHQMHDNLVEVYGGESDTDSEDGYESDLDMKKLSF